MKFISHIALLFIIISECYAIDNIVSPIAYNKAADTDVHAPEKYSGIMLRISDGKEILYRNLLYEGNNLIMRRPLNSKGLSILSGEEIAEKWRSKARQTRKLFILRDSLFSQQDNILKNKPFSLMLPPNWITAALISSSLKPVVAPDIMDDDDWATIKSPDIMFGSFPPSYTLYKISKMNYKKSSVGKKKQIIYVRTAIRMLANCSNRLIKASKYGHNAIAKEGADIIAESDRQYFGEKIRRDNIIPIFVENPTPHEMKLGKGLYIYGRDDIPNDIIHAGLKEIYSKRLQHGDIAIERYDISNKIERKRAIKVLEMLIPKKSIGVTNIWLWVTGPLKEGENFVGENATEYINTFKSEIKSSDINTDRLKYISKPDYKLSEGPNREKEFQMAVEYYKKLDLPLGLNINTRTFRKLISEEIRKN
jgi:hypothetical protein